MGRVGSLVLALFLTACHVVLPLAHRRDEAPDLAAAPDTLRDGPPSLDLADGTPALDQHREDAPTSEGSPTCPPKVHYDGNFAQPAWYYHVANSPIADATTGYAVYNNPSLGGTAAWADPTGKFTIDPGCTLKITLDAEIASDVLSIRLYDYYCEHTNVLLPATYCTNPVVSCSFSTSGSFTTTVPDSTTIFCVLLYRSHSKDGTATARHLRIEQE